MSKRLVFLLFAFLLPALACNLPQAGQPALSFPEMTREALATSDPLSTISDTPVPASSPLPTTTSGPTLPAGTAAVVATRQAGALTATAYRTRTAAPSPTVRPPTAAPKPICSVLNDVRLRQLPNIDAIWIRTLVAGEVLIPLQYQSDGEWLKVQVQDTQETGWVTANSEVIGCNMDISQLK